MSDQLDELGREMIKQVCDLALSWARRDILGTWAKPESNEHLHRRLIDTGFTPEQIEVLWKFLINATHNTTGCFLKYIDLVVARGQLRGELLTRDGEVIGPFTVLYDVDKTFQFEWAEQFSKYSIRKPFTESEG